MSQDNVLLAPGIVLIPHKNLIRPSSEMLF